jgi:threonine dehydrogenase-like Zn-dependent dehydrogenase
MILTIGARSEVVPGWSGKGSGFTQTKHWSFLGSSQYNQLALLIKHFPTGLKMAPIAQKKSLGNVLVIGGCGFLGHHIVDLILSTYSASVSVLDLRTTRNRRPDADGVQYFDGDITSLDSILPVFQKMKPDVVIHTASPTLAGGSKEMYRKVNVEGTRTVIEACQKTNVKVLVYTSSASVIHDNSSDLINADERWPVIPPKMQTEYYSLTKVGALICNFLSPRIIEHLSISLSTVGCAWTNIHVG